MNAQRGSCRLSTFRSRPTVALLVLPSACAPRRLASRPAFKVSASAADDGGVDLRDRIAVGMCPVDAGRQFDREAVLCAAQPEADADAAGALAVRVRDALAALQINVASSIDVTF